jgi:hypothetical protein
VQISGLSVKIMRKLHLDHSPTDGLTIEVSDTLLTVPFHGPQYTVQSFSEGVAHLVVTVPRNARGVRPGPREALDSDGSSYMKSGLFYVQCYLTVSISTGFMAYVHFIRMPHDFLHKFEPLSFMTGPALRFPFRSEFPSQCGSGNVTRANKLCTTYRHSSSGSHLASVITP